MVTPGPTELGGAYREPASCPPGVDDVALVVAYRAYTRRVRLIAILSTLILGLAVFADVYRVLAAELAQRRHAEWPWGTTIASTVLTALVVVFFSLAFERGVFPCLRTGWARRRGLRLGLETDQVLRRVF